MQVQVLYFGVLKDVTGLERHSIEVESGTSVGALLVVLQAQTSKQSEVWTSLAVAINREYVGRRAVLKDGDEVALLPPVSGGR